MNRHRFLKFTLEKTQTTIDRLMVWRLVFGFGFLFSVAGLIFAEPKSLGFAFGLLFGLVFYFLVRSYNLRRQFHLRLKRWLQLLERIDTRQTGRSASLGQAVFLPKLDREEQILNQDLNLFGEASVFGLINECFSDAGEQALAAELTRSDLDLHRIQSEQTKIQNLTRRIWQIKKFFVIGGAERVEFLKIALHLKNPLASNPLQLFALVAFWVLSIVFTFITEIPWLLLPFSLVSWSMASKHVSVFSVATDLSLNLKTLNPILGFARKYSDLFRLQRKDIPNSGAFELALSMLSVQAHPIVYLVLNALTPWTCFSAWLAERWRKLEGPRMLQFIEKVHGLEVDGSKALFTKYQTSTFPEFSQTFAIEGLYHPLIPRSEAVANDLKFTKDERILLITGSNMSGKSTFLRALAVNHILALMGCPVFAKSLRLPLARPMTCLRVSDSLADEFSSFYFEATRAKDILTSAFDRPIVFYIDEIFRGTNNRERLIGSRALLLRLLESELSFGFVTSHDLELASLASEEKGLKLCHFSDDLKDQRLNFSYRLKEGVSPSTNALEIMRSLGLPIGK